MRVIIAGSRDLKDHYHLVEQAVIDSGFDVTTVISGGAPGIDSHGEEWALNRGIKFIVIPAQWSRLGNRAGPIRNTWMAEEGEALIALPRGKSFGTRDMISKAWAKGLKVYVHEVEE